VSKYKPSLPFRESAHMVCRGAVIAAPFILADHIATHFGFHFGWGSTLGNLAIGSLLLRKNFESHMREIFGPTAITRSPQSGPLKVAFLSTVTGHGVAATFYGLGATLMDLRNIGDHMASLGDIRNSRVVFFVVAPLVYSFINSIIAQNDSSQA